MIFCCKPSNLFYAQAFACRDGFFAQEFIKFATEERDGGDATSDDHGCRAVGDSRLVQLLLENDAQYEQNPPVNGEDDKCVPGNVPEDSADNAKWRYLRKSAYGLECEDEPDDAEKRCGDEHRQAFAEVVVHDAEIRIRSFKDSVKHEGDDGDGCRDCRVQWLAQAILRLVLRNIAFRSAHEFFANPSAGEEKEYGQVAFNSQGQSNVVLVK